MLKRNTELYFLLPVDDHRVYIARMVSNAIEHVFQDIWKDVMRMSMNWLQDLRLLPHRQNSAQSEEGRRRKRGERPRSPTPPVGEMRRRYHVNNANEKNVTAVAETNAVAEGWWDGERKRERERENHFHLRLCINMCVCAHACRTSWLTALQARLTGKLQKLQRKE